MRSLNFLALIACSGPVLGEGSSSLEHPRMAAMLEAHNDARAFATPDPVPPLAPLGWSDALASDAAEWTGRCRAAHDPRLDGQGESWYATSSSGQTTAWDVVVAWASESADYDLEANACTGTCGHYTQLVWRETTEVGCAFQACESAMGADFRDGGEIWVCRYAPAGNSAGERPYEPG